MSDAGSAGDFADSAKFALIVVASLAAIVLALGFIGVSSFGNAGKDADRHDDVADWDQAESMAGLFDVEWPESASNVYFASNVWFSRAYEVRIDMDTAAAVALVAAVPDCLPVDAIPIARITEGWWDVGEAESWQGCQTDPSVGWSNSVVVDPSDTTVATVYLAHFQPDS